MYKLILVDDEEEVRKGIIEKIEWNKYGFEVAGEAENGIEALEIVEKTVPDVVITDIKMPYMDGLILVEKLRDRFPATKIVFLTGLDEFECAQKAIKLNVIEYILKPVSSDELMDILVKIKTILDAEISQRKDIEMLRQHYRKSLPLFRDKFLGSVVASRLKRNEILNKSKSFGLNMEGEGFIISVLSIDFETDDNKSKGDQINPKKDPFSIMSEDRELLEFAALNISEEITGKYGIGITFIHNDYIVFIFNSPANTKEILLERCITILEETRMCIEKYLGVTSTIGVGSFCQDIEALNGSYEDAVTALDYSMVLSKNRVIYIEDLEPQNVKKVIFNDIKERSLTSCIKVGTSEEISLTIGSLFNDIISAKVSFKECQIYLIEMLTAVLKVAKDLSVDLDKLFGTTYNLIAEIYRLKEFNDVRDWMTGICIKIRNDISKDRRDTCKLVVKKAVEYVQANYHDSEITIEKVCKYLHISPAYFSTLFKREVDLTFNNYLTQTRMEAAKELLRTSGIKNFEIAQRVGFSEPNYFSYCFKKNFGISPSEYRKVSEKH